MIATHGFTQGPGQALALGNIWENELGIEHAVNFGLINASFGFIAAFLVGVPIARSTIRAGLNFNKAARIDDEFLKGLLTSDVSAGKQITHSANVDSLVYHIAILGVAYVLTDQYLVFMAPILPSYGIITICAVYIGTFVLGAIALLLFSRRVGAPSNSI